MDLSGCRMDKPTSSNFFIFCNLGIQKGLFWKIQIVGSIKENHRHRFFLFKKNLIEIPPNVLAIPFVIQILWECSSSLFITSKEKLCLLLRIS